MHGQHYPPLKELAIPSMLSNSHLLEMPSVFGSQKGKSGFVNLLMSPGPTFWQRPADSRCKKGWEAQGRDLLGFVVQGLGLRVEG